MKRFDLNARKSFCSSSEGSLKRLKREPTGFRKVRKTELLYAAVAPEIKESVRRLAGAMGISMSEYLRRLILADLDNRTVFTAELKKGSEDVAHRD